MIQDIFEKINNNNIPLQCRILCAVSGGIDSVVMLYILKELDFDCIVAHCNFKLREEESDRDENFVRQLAQELNIKFLFQTFDTANYAKETGISIQMAARDLRYEWFHEMANLYNCNFIALAHNSDDQAETIITNLIRGTGIRGLTGMSFLKDKLLRPLLNISRKQIEDFATKNNIHYCNDSTNNTTKYSRNKIRHSIFPLMKEINSSYKKNILKSINYLKDAENIMNDYVKNIKEKCVYYNDNKTFINIKKLKTFVSENTIFYELLLLEGVPKTLASEAVYLLNSQSGKKVSFMNIDILRDRHNIIIKNKTANDFITTEIKENFLVDLKKFGITAQIVDNTENITISRDKNFAYINFDKLIFPIQIRKWRDGDKFKPFGMNKTKKLSDFLTDQKLSIFEKDETAVLISNENIFWIVGQRIDNRYRITNNCKKIMILKFNE